MSSLRIRVSVLAVLAILLVGFVSAATGANPLSAKDRREVFEDVWKTVNEKYYDTAFNGVDWNAVRAVYAPLAASVTSDEALYVLLKKMVGELHDAHAQVHTPRERRGREQGQAVSAGLLMFEVEGKPIVTSVEPDSDAARAGFAPGMEVLSIDGRPMAELLADTRARVNGSSSATAERTRLYRQLITGEPGTSVTLVAAGKDGIAINATLVRRVIDDAPKVTVQQLPSGYGYIKLNLWKSPMHERVKSALRTLKESPGLIMDLRGNPGGEVGQVVRIADYFFGVPTSFGQFISRSGKPTPMYVPGFDQVYKGPVVVLVNEWSGSGSELFAGVMQESGRATVIGTRTCGCVLAITRFKKLKGGGEFGVSELRYVSPRGNKLEGTGVIPDRTVPLTIADLQGGKDSVVTAAEGLLRDRSR